MHARAPVRFVPLFLLTVCLLSCGESSPTGSSDDREHKEIRNVGRVAFMGNSLTSVNSLVVMVDSLASVSGIHIQSLEVAHGNYALIDHWNNPSSRGIIENGHFDYVIMQQGPSSLPENRDSLRIWSELWEPTIRATGAIPGLYAVWPDRSRFFAFHDVSESYRLAALAVNGLFFPVGDTWLETWRLNPDARLYGPDDFHPSLAGTYAAAVVIVSVLSNRRATSLSPDFRIPALIGGSIDSTLAATIRRAADTVIDRYRQDAGGDRGPDGDQRIRTTLTVCRPPGVVKTP